LGHQTHDFVGYDSKIKTVSATTPKSPGQSASLQQTVMPAIGEINAAPVAAAAPPTEQQHHDDDQRIEQESVFLDSLHFSGKNTTMKVATTSPMGCYTAEQQDLTP